MKSYTIHEEYAIIEIEKERWGFTSTRFLGIPLDYADKSNKERNEWFFEFGRYYKAEENTKKRIESLKKEKEGITKKLNQLKDKEWIKQTISELTDTLKKITKGIEGREKALKNFKIEGIMNDIISNIKEIRSTKKRTSKILT